MRLNELTEPTEVVGKSPDRTIHTHKPFMYRFLGGGAIESSLHLKLVLCGSEKVLDDEVIVSSQLKLIRRVL